jgi:hypothetical protein
MRLKKSIIVTMFILMFAFSLHTYRVTRAVKPVEADQDVNYCMNFAIRNLEEAMTEEDEY